MKKIQILKKIHKMFADETQVDFITLKGDIDRLDKATEALNASCLSLALQHRRLTEDELYSSELKRKVWKYLPKEMSAMKKISILNSLSIKLHFIYNLPNQAEKYQDKRGAISIYRLALDSSKQLIEEFAAFN